MKNKTNDKKMKMLWDYIMKLQFDGKIMIGRRDGFYEIQIQIIENKELN